MLEKKLDTNQSKDFKNVQFFFVIKKSSQITISDFHERISGH